jgi:hypothetical protein
MRNRKQKKKKENSPPLGLVVSGPSHPTPLFARPLPPLLPRPKQSSSARARA